ncbi:hypothetical protein ACFC60_19845 [Kitasatospora purpeofusca]|uniref:hypothetical protein n=1 Tax=Kitasatospora purpeofusca TaxID=67352 RepID=UPI0035D5A1F7
MNGRIVSLLGLPALAAGALLVAAPAHAATAVRIDSATVPGSASVTTNVAVEYSCDPRGLVRTAAVIAEDRGSGALGVTRFTPTCTGAAVTAVVPVKSLNRNSYVAGNPGSFRLSLMDLDDTEVLGVITRLAIRSA